MLSIAAAALAAASVASPPAPTSTSPWWEKVTYTISSDGAQESCQYESSLSTARPVERCDSEESSSPIKPKESSTPGGYTKITIERRFTPGSQLVAESLDPGDTLIGGQIMALSIDATGAVRNCRIVAASSNVRPAYGCDEARAERFEASAGRTTAPEARQGFLTIIVYGHQAHVA